MANSTPLVHSWQGVGGGGCWGYKVPCVCSLPSRMYTSKVFKMTLVKLAVRRFLLTEIYIT